MIRAIAAGAMLVVCSAGLASGHQIDELLQATRLDVTMPEVVIQVTLAPGAEVAPLLRAHVDGDGDGVVSESELRAYGLRVIRGSTLTVDGSLCDIAVGVVSTTPWAAMEDGIGEIRLGGTCKVELRPGSHRVRYVNARQPVPTSYLVNALQPTDQHIEIGPLRRTATQEDAAFEVAIHRVLPSTVWSVAALGMVSIPLLVFGRLRRLPRHSAGGGRST